ncbi:bifunctional (p)ppGpp synthetase/guanosine-3',5'-bis(diphosphate) 3'-pyrophosphohydrolase [Candidatus Fermentibacteria bacterium]|nr:bifunctional (p)ppGpp synthetase/guanosine-3',5'-bis(diphosphate) 3'-pyrophosphohydrolase [Candidatus Fermentibacteria bacterium]
MTLSSDAFIAGVRDLDPSLDTVILGRAFDMASAAHRDQMRASGEAYFSHPQAVALTVARLGQGSDAVAAALLHDVVEDGGVTIDNVRRAFGPGIATLVAALSKMSALETPQREARQAEYFRRLLLALGEDVRVIVIKLADRLHNMQTLSFLAPDRQRSIATETLDIYAPLAHRLGMGWFRVQLEDLAFKELDPASYQQMKERVAARREERESMVEGLAAPLAAMLTAEGICGQVVGRVKHFYGIYRKMKLNGKSFDEIFDLVGLRVITQSVEDCYRALGLAHTMWAPVEGRFKDYIAVPKPNMYQSIHTTVKTEEGVTVELQIRTSVMDTIAEFGVAAHWRYHLEQTGKRYVAKEHFRWIRQLLESETAEDARRDLLGAFRDGTRDAEVMVLTPRGKLIPMRAGSTALDFAFSLHSDIGLHCAGARVNGKAVTLDHVLSSGDQVEILTSPAAHPTPGWLTRVAGTSARQKIRRYLRRAERERLQASGRTLLLRYLRKEKLPLPKTGIAWDELAQTLQYPTVTELLHAAAIGAVSRSHLAALRPKEEPSPSQEPLRDIPHEARGIRLGDLRGIAVRFAECCRPIPGDRITAMVTRGRGASIHRVDCSNAFRGDAERWITVEWDVAHGETFSAHLAVLVGQRRTVLGDMEAAIQGAGARLGGIEITSDIDGSRWLQLVVVVTGTQHVDAVLTAIRKLPGVLEAARGRPTRPGRRVQRAIQS